MRKIFFCLKPVCGNEVVAKTYIQCTCNCLNSPHKGGNCLRFARSQTVADLEVKINIACSAAIPFFSLLFFLAVVDDTDLFQLYSLANAIILYGLKGLAL